MTADVLFSDLDAFFGGDVPKRLGVAVSGGSDSLALLHLLSRWGKSELHVVTVDHGLRAEAAAEASFVADICASLGHSHDVVTLQGWDGQGNVMDQARRNRYRLIADWARERDLEMVALGHTQTDVAETLLMRLTRAAGVDGLAAMAPQFERDGMGFVRPLLTRSRVELRRYLESLGQSWIDDPSNEDPGFDRVRIRNAMEDLALLGLGEGTLARVADNLAQARQALGFHAADWVKTHVQARAGELIFDKTAFLALPSDQAHRILGHGFRHVSSADYPPRGDALQEVIKTIDAAKKRTLHGCVISTTQSELRVTRELNATKACGTSDLWDRRWTLTGPQAEQLEIKALADGIDQCPTWRETGLTRDALMVTPAIWRGSELQAAPLAGLPNGWHADVPGVQAFADSLPAA